MKKVNRPTGSGAKKTWNRVSAPESYQAVVDGLVSEMADLVSETEPRKFSPPFRLVIIDNRGSVAFAGQADRDGKVQASSPIRKMRRSDFPANALITDRSLATRTFRIDYASRKSVAR